MFVPSLISGNGISVNERHSRTEIEGYLKGIRLRAASPSQQGLKTINATAKSLGCKITDIIDLLHGDQLKTVAWDDSKIGLSAILVEPTEVARLAVSNNTDHLAAYQLARSWKMSAEFVFALVRLGALPTVEGVGVRNKSRHRLIRRTDADAFLARYVTFQNAAREFSVTRTRLREAIRRANLAPLFPYDELRALLFDRRAVDVALSAIQGERLPHERRKSLNALRSAAPKN
jgi:hypothetical protein